ncbi:hypothetical protein [Streptomyces sp. NPDC002851]
MEAATSLNVAVFCLSIALGATVSGRLIDALSPTAVIAAGALLPLVAALVTAAHRKEPRTS